MLREIEEQSEEERLRAQEEEEEDIEEIVDPKWERKVQEHNLQPVSYTSHVYTWRRDKFDPPSGNGLQFWQGFWVNNKESKALFTSATSKGIRDKHDIYRSVVAIDCKVHFHYKIGDRDKTKIFRIKQIATEITRKNGFPRLAQDSEYDCSEWVIWHKQTQYPLPPLHLIKAIDDAVTNGTPLDEYGLFLIYLVVNLFLTLLEDRVDARLDEDACLSEATKLLEEEKLITLMFNCTQHSVFSDQLMKQKEIY